MFLTLTVTVTLMMMAMASLPSQPTSCLPLFFLVSAQLRPSFSLLQNACHHRSYPPELVRQDRRHPLPLSLSNNKAHDAGYRHPSHSAMPCRSRGILTGKGTAYLNSQPQHSHGDVDREAVKSRRSFLAGASMSALTSSAPTIANALGLVRFPCKVPLLNKYHLLRAGTSLLEEENVLSTNPLFLTNREAALSEIGKEQVTNACRYLASSGLAPTIVRYSLAAASIDSANIVGAELKIGRDRLVPEFNFMDPRAIGGWDYGALNATEEAVWALDADEAGRFGKNGNPPPNEDGTPNETLADVVVRLTNLMSVLETQYSGDTVLLVFPDGTGPALLSCLIGGIPLNRVHEFQFASGEVRCDVTYNSMAVLASPPPLQTYLDAIARGRVELKQLRENPDALTNVKDLEYEKERAQENQKQEAARQEILFERQREQRRDYEIEEKKKLEAKQKREAEEKAKELERRKKREQILLQKREQEAKQREERKANELGRLKEETLRKNKEQEAKQKEDLMITKRERSSGNDTNQRSLDASSIRAFATIAGGVALISSSLFGDNESGEMAAGGNSTESLSTLVDPAVEHKDDVSSDVSSNCVDLDESSGNINVENNSTHNNNSNALEMLLEGPVNSTSRDNITHSNAAMGAKENVGMTAGGNNDFSESSSMPTSSLPGVVDLAAKDDQVIGEGIGTDAEAIDIVADDNSAPMNDSLCGPSNEADSESSHSKTQTSVIDNDDWDDAWLGSISEIIADCNED